MAQKIFAGPGNMVEVIRGFSAGLNQVTVFLTPGGDFIYQNGNKVHDKKDLQHVPAQYNAMAWFKANYPKTSLTEEAPEAVKTEPKHRGRKPIIRKVKNDETHQTVPQV